MLLKFFSLRLLSNSSKVRTDLHFREPGLVFRLRSWRTSRERECSNWLLKWISSGESKPKWAKQWIYQSWPRFILFSFSESFDRNWDSLLVFSESLSHEQHWLVSCYMNQWIFQSWPRITPLFFCESVNQWVLVILTGACWSWMWKIILFLHTKHIKQHNSSNS